MKVTVLIPTALRSYADEAESAEVDADTAEAALAQLVERHSKLKPHLFTPAGEVRNFVNVFVNDTNARDLGRNVKLKAGDVVTIVPAVAGGATRRGNFRRSRR